MNPLDPRKARLDYGEALHPPHGYELDRALAATYSLDLATLLSIPTGLIYRQTLEEECPPSPIALLHAAKRFAGRVTVFHQAGQIHRSQKPPPVFAFLEECLVPVVPHNGFSSFHPKIWLVRFKPVDQGDPRPAVLRLIVLSRNITFDRSWDLAATMDGELGKKPVAENRALVSFLAYLERLAPQRGLDSLVKDAACTRFTTPAPFDSHAFRPTGFPEAEPGSTESAKAVTRLVVSPFLHPETIRRLTQSPLHLVSNPHELAALPAELWRNLQAYHLDPRVSDDLNPHSDDDMPPGHSLHAKLLVEEDNAKGVTWLLGSANATEAARLKNIEFMLELQGSHRSLRPKSVLANLLGTPDRPGPFVACDPSTLPQASSGDSMAAELRRFEYALLCADICGWVSEAKGGTGFDLEISLPLEGIGSGHFALRVAPLHAASLVPVKLGTNSAVRFGNIPEVHLSRFLQVCIADAEGGDTLRQFLMMIDVNGLPSTRLDCVLRQLVDSSASFFSYVQFILSDEVSRDDLVRQFSGPATRGQGGARSATSLPLFEQLLFAASRRPERLDEIQALTRKLDPIVVPRAFKELLDHFCSLPPS